MKVRNGFVSNSSSSSFVIAVRKDTEGKNEEIFKYVLELAASVNQKIKSSNVGQEREQLQKELVKLTRDLSFQEKQHAALEEICKDKLFCRKLRAVDEALSLVGSGIHWTVLSQVRATRERVHDGVRHKEWYKLDSPLETALDRSKYALKDIRPEIERVQEKLKKLEELADDQQLYSFDEDHSFGSGISRAIAKMVEDGKVIEVERTST